MPTPPAPLVSEQRRFLHVFGGSSTSDNLNKFASNDGLSGTVVQNLVLANHLTSVLGGIVHGVSAGRLLAGVTLSESPEEGVGKAVLAEVAENLLINLEGGEIGRLEDGLLGKCLNEGRLVAGGIDELVVQNLDVGVLGGEEGDLVGDGLGIGEGRNVLADTSKGELDALGAGTGELGLALLADNDEVGGAVLFEGSTDLTAHAGVNTTAETLVGGADDDEGLLLLGLGGLGLGGFEDLVGGLAVAAGLGHGTLGAGELGGGDDLHGVGDLLDVLDGLEAAVNFSKRRVASGGAGSSSSNPSGSCSRSAESRTSCSRQHLDGREGTY
jgi:hypothetical protein